MAAFSATRTYHRVACAIEESGFEIRDIIEWCYLSGTPLQFDLGKAFAKKYPNQPNHLLGQKSKLVPAHEPICLANSCGV